MIYYCYEIISSIHFSETFLFQCFFPPLSFFSCQFPIPCSDSHLGLPGLCSAWPRSSCVQHNSLCCSHACHRSHLPRVRVCILALVPSQHLFHSLQNIWILFLTLVFQGCVSGWSVWSRGLCKYLNSSHAVHWNQWKSCCCWIYPYCSHSGWISSSLQSGSISICCHGDLQWRVGAQHRQCF